MIPAAALSEERIAGTGLDPVDDASEFQLGGAVSRAALVSDLTVEGPGEPAALPRLSLPRSPGDRALDLRETVLGPATLFFGEGWDEGRDAVQVGTFLSRGGARAGLSVTYLEEARELARSELFVDYALSESFSVGVSGMLNARGEDASVPQLGLSAEYATRGGAFLQGGVAGADAYEPVIGVSVGLRF